jgi:hypothetical protein
VSEQQAASCGVPRQELDEGIRQINVAAKRITPPLRQWLWTFSPCSLLLYAAISWYIAIGLCDDPSPSDYFRVACVEMDESTCSTRTLEPLEELYPECRSVCTADMADEELRATANPDGGQCLTCNLPEPLGEENEEGIYRPRDTRNMGCQCGAHIQGSVMFAGEGRCKDPAGREEVDFVGVEEFDALRRRPCRRCGKGGYRGCQDIEYTRVCDDEVVPFPFLMPIGAVFGTCGIIVVGMIFAQQHRKADAGLTSLCGALSGQSQSGARWEYIAAAEGKYKCVTVTSVVLGNGVQATPMAVAANVQVIKSPP